MAIVIILFNLPSLSPVVWSLSSAGARRRPFAPRALIYVCSSTPVQFESKIKLIYKIITTVTVLNIYFIKSLYIKHPTNKDFKDRRFE